MKEDTIKTIRTVIALFALLIVFDAAGANTHSTSAQVAGAKTNDNYISFAHSNFDGTVEDDGETVEFNEDGSVDFDQGPGGDSGTIETDNSLDVTESDGTNVQTDTNTGTGSFTEPNGDSGDFNFDNSGDASVDVNTPDEDFSGGNANVRLEGNASHNLDINDKVNRSLNVDLDNIQVNFSGGNGTGQIEILGPNGDVEISGEEGSLSVQASSNNLSANARGAIITLKGQSDKLIDDENDFVVYANLVAQERSSVKAVRFTDEGINVRYNQPAKLFGLFRASLNGDVVVTSNGTVRVKLPWYSFLFSKNVDSVEKNIVLGLNTATQDDDVEIVSLSADSGAIKFRTAAHVLNVISTTAEGVNQFSLETDSAEVQTNQDNVQTEGNSGAVQSDGSNTQIESDKGSSLDASEDSVQLEGRDGGTLDLNEDGLNFTR